MATPEEDRKARGPAIIAAAIVGAALILSWGVSKDEPRYQIASSGDGVVRMDTDSGEMIACNAQSCRRIEAPDRAKTFGPLTVEIGDDAEKKAPPKPAN
ncbi:hypothetical protein [Sphingomonas sp.]|uniref:hypothetical protein n=1 Tax=Sphingomonas sp. TaxID=28214 RepID=UPI0025E02877|nr:hypothetical protein [Sphingomonas sp.]